MSTIIAFLLVVIAGAMWFKKPFKIEVYHKHESVTPLLIEKKPEDVKNEDKEAYNLDDVVKTLNEAMGVIVDE
jgi:hypothetical protein